MTRFFPLVVFTSVFAFVYYACFVFGYTPVRFYPLLGEISMQDLPRAAGPAMGWFTWIVIGAGAGLVAGIAAYLVPKTLGDKVWSGFSWLIPTAVCIWIIYVEWHWFVE